MGDRASGPTMYGKDMAPKMLAKGLGKQETRILDPPCIHGSVVNRCKQGRLAVQWRVMGERCSPQKAKAQGKDQPPLARDPPPCLQLQWEASHLPWVCAQLLLWVCEQRPQWVCAQHLQWVCLQAQTKQHLQPQASCRLKWARGHRLKLLKL